MFSGKTQRLIARLCAAAGAGRRVLAIKHVIDDRYDATHLITHDEQRFPASRARSAAEIERLAADAETIAIDEGHFFGRELVAVVQRLLAGGRDVVVAGLEFNAWGRPFEPMPTLAAQADAVHTHTAPCRRCGEPAHYSQRLVPVATDLMVGGAEAYEPRCERCFESLPGDPPGAAP